MRNQAAAIPLMLTAAMMVACASMPAESGKLAAARSALMAAESRGEMAGVAQTNLVAARYYLEQAEVAGRNGADRRNVDTLAYAAEQLATAAIARNESMMLEDRESRERAARMAEHRAETAELEAERARLLADRSK